MFDCHIHSNFSFDSSMFPRNACDIAIKKGLDGIAFVDHLDYDFPGYEDAGLIDFSDYSEFMDRLKKEYNRRIKVLKGIEVGIQPHVIDSSSNIVKKYDFDFVIGSVHIVDGDDPYCGEYYNGKTKHQAYKTYLQKILSMINSFDDFDVTAHFYYITRYAQYTDNSLKYHDHSELFDSIFKVLISKGKGFEVNTGSFKDKNDGRNVPVYDIDILKRYKELGGEILCMGSDAHNTRYIGYKFEFFKDIIKRAGFKYLTHFEQRKPVFLRID